VQGNLFPNHNLLFVQVVASPFVPEAEAVAVTSVEFGCTTGRANGRQVSATCFTGDAQRRPSTDSVMYKYSRAGDEERG
jgi:hypothetical protein